MTMTLTDSHDVPAIRYLGLQLPKREYEVFDTQEEAEAYLGDGDGNLYQIRRRPRTDSVGELDVSTTSERLPRRELVASAQKFKEGQNVGLIATTAPSQPYQRGVVEGYEGDGMYVVRLWTVYRSDPEEYDGLREVHEDQMEPV